MSILERLRELEKTTTRQEGEPWLDWRNRWSYENMWLRNNLPALLEVVEALENLMEEQNGPPLSLPRHAIKWQKAMDEAQKALAKLEAPDA